MSDMITVHGMVATTVRFIETSDGRQIASFRLMTKEDDQTNWFTVSLVTDDDFPRRVANKIRKADRVSVTGTLKVRDWESGDHSGTTIELIATHIGLDLAHELVERVDDYPISRLGTVQPNAKQAKDIERYVLHKAHMSQDIEGDIFAVIIDTDKVTMYHLPLVEDTYIEYRDFSARGWDSI